MPCTYPFLNNLKIDENYKSLCYAVVVINCAKNAYGSIVMDWTDSGISFNANLYSGYISISPINFGSPYRGRKILTIHK